MIEQIISAWSEPGKEIVCCWPGGDRSVLWKWEVWPRGGRVQVVKTGNQLCPAVIFIFHDLRAIFGDCWCGIVALQFKTLFWFRVRVCQSLHQWRFIVYCWCSRFLDTDGSGWWHDGEVWDLGHGWSGALPQPCPDVLPWRTSRYCCIWHNQPGSLLCTFIHECGLALNVFLNRNSRCLKRF